MNTYTMLGVLDQVAAVEALMRHKSYLTTKKYINMARQLDGAVEQLHVPEFLKST